MAGTAKIWNPSAKDVKALVKSGHTLRITRDYQESWNDQLEYPVVVYQKTTYFIGGSETTRQAAARYTEIISKMDAKRARDKAQ